MQPSSRVLFHTDLSHVVGAPWPTILEDPNFTKNMSGSLVLLMTLGRVRPITAVNKQSRTRRMPVLLKTTPHYLTFDICSTGMPPARLASVFNTPIR